MLKVYRDYVHTSNDISDEILGLTAFTAGLNMDWTLELPETEIVTTIDDFAPDEKIVVALASDTSKQIVFYVESVSYDYDSRKYTLRCPHILKLLERYRSAEIQFPPYGDPLTGWSDVTPSGTSGYSLYNNQMGNGATQAQYIWERSYVQILFLMKMLIYKATGVSVADINSTEVDAKESFYARRYWSNDHPAGWRDQIFTYAELGMSVSSVDFMGMASSEIAWSTDYFVRAGHMNCLTLLGWLCSQLGMTIDLFRSDYQFQTVANTAAPSNANTIGRNDQTIEQIRKYAIKVKGLDSDPDFVFGEYNSGLSILEYYTWGVDSPDVELIDRQEEEENTSVTTTRQQAIILPIFFRIYYIAVNTNDYYRSRIYVIKEDELDFFELKMWLNYYYAFWQNIATKAGYTIPMTTLAPYWARGTYDAEARKITYERWI